MPPSLRIGDSIGRRRQGVAWRRTMRAVIYDTVFSIALPSVLGAI